VVIPPRGGKSALVLSAGSVPSRVDACVKAGLLDLVDRIKGGRGPSCSDAQHP